MLTSIPFNFGFNYTEGQTLADVSVCLVFRHAPSQERKGLRAICFYSQSVLGYMKDVFVFRGQELVIYMTRTLI